jgi:SseB protein N-terminal domain
VAAALTAYADGTGCEHAVLVALAGCRLLVPVVALPAEPAGGLWVSSPRPAAVAAEDAAAPGAGGTGEGGPVPVLAGEKRSEMATPALVGRDGRRALVAFTCVDAVRRWQPAARPVPVPADAVFQSAVAEGCALVVDVAGPVPVAVDGFRLAALAGSGPLPRMHEDPDVWQLVAVAAGAVAPGIRIRLGEPAPGAEFILELAPPPGVPGLVPEDVVTQVAQAVRQQLADRVRSAIAVVRLPG